MQSTLKKNNILIKKQKSHYTFRGFVLIILVIGVCAGASFICEKTKIVLAAPQASQALYGLESEYVARWMDTLAISADGNVTVAGSRRSDGYSGQVVYIYRRTSGVWAQDGKLSSGNFAFGDSVDISADGSIIVAGPDFNNKAYVYLYNAVLKSWPSTPTYTITTSDAIVKISPDASARAVTSTDARRRLEKQGHAGLGELGELDALLPAGARAIACAHTKSGEAWLVWPGDDGPTLVACDSFFHVPEPVRGFRGWVLRRMKISPGLAFGWTYKYLCVTDRPAYRDWASATIREIAPRRLAVSHGDTLEDGALADRLCALLDERCV